MKKIIGIAVRALIIILSVLWMILIIVESNRYKKDEPMLIVVKEKTITYDDGYTYVYYGLGYKTIIYERESLTGKEFGHIFTKVRDKMPEKK